MKFQIESTLGGFERGDCVHLKLLVRKPAQLTTVLKPVRVSTTLNTKSTWDTVPGFCTSPGHSEKW